MIRHVAGTSGVAVGINSAGTVGSSFNPILTIRDVSVVVSGGTVGNQGIRAIYSPKMKNVDVTVSGTTARGLTTNCAQAANVQVRVRGASASTGTATGWVDFYDDCTKSKVIQFDIDVKGAASMTGLSLDSGGSVFSGGFISTFGTGLIVYDYRDSSSISNVVISGAQVGIDARLETYALYLNNIIVGDAPSNSTALKISSDDTNVVVANSILVGGTTGVWLAQGPGRLRIDRSTIEGGVNSILGDASGSVNIGSSKIVGPISLSAGSLSCLYVYDDNYQPVTCP